jgi:hypothetical protein
VRGDITPSDDTIDSRDVMVALEDAREARDAYNDEHPEGPAYAEAHPIEAQELAALERLAEEGAGYAADWHYGVTLIRDSYLVEYVREIVENNPDIPELPDYLRIDWNATADEFKQDYTAVEFDGVTYWIR